MKALLNEAFGSGESSPNPFPFIMELSSKVPLLSKQVFDLLFAFTAV